ALGQRRRLLAERGLVFLVGHAVVERVVEGQAAGGADGAGDPAPPGRRLAGQPGALDVQLARAVADLVLVELEPGAAERIGLDDVAASVEVAPVDAGHDVGVGVVPQLGTGPVEQAGGEQHRAVAAVEDQRLPGPDTRENLRPPRRHRPTSAVTPTSWLAFTTASVESFA